MREIKYREAINEALREEMIRDKSVFVMGEDVGQFGGVFQATATLYKDFGPSRVLDTPISASRANCISFSYLAVNAALCPALYSSAHRFA